MTLFFFNSRFIFLIFLRLSETLPMIKERHVEVGHALWGCLEVISVSPFRAIALTMPDFTDSLAGCSGGK